MSNNEQTTTEAGDIVLYAGDRIIVFYGSNSCAYTKPGHIDQTQKEMEKLLGHEDAEIEQIKDVPIWFLHAMTDMVVDPEITSVPTYKRLMEAGAENTHFTYIDDRPPLNRMINHGCWPLGLNNEHNYDFDGKPVLLDGKPVTRFEWLANMHK